MQYHVQLLVTLELTDVTLEVGPGQSEGQGEGGADQTVTAQSPGHPGVRPVILIRENMIQSSCLLYCQEYDFEVQCMRELSSTLTIWLLMKYLSFAGGLDSGEVQLTCNDDTLPW